VSRFFLLILSQTLKKVKFKDSLKNNRQNIRFFQYWALSLYCCSLKCWDFWEGGADCPENQVVSKPKSPDSSIGGTSVGGANVA
jgi:hypothetical protein